MTTPPVDPAKRAKWDDANVAAAQAAAATAAAQAEAAGIGVASARLAADQAVASAQQARVASLIPDFSSIAQGSLDVKGDSANLAAGLLDKALNATAKALAKEITDKAGDGPVLVTSDTDLITSSGVYRQVVGSLAELKKMADGLLAAKPADVKALLLTDVAAGVAKAIPGVLSLFAPHDTLDASGVPVDDLAAAVFVIHHLLDVRPGRNIQHDTFRVLGNSKLYEDAQDLAGQVPQLLASKVPNADQAKALAKSITDTLTALTSVPQGAARSPMASAAAWEPLLRSTGRRTAVTRILLVKSETGAASSLIRRRFWRDTGFFSATARITYMLINAETSEVLASGGESQTCRSHDKLTEMDKADPPLPKG
jgi:hypothetical protein